MIFREERETLATLEPVRITGEISRVVGLVAECHGLAVPVGGRCEIQTRSRGLLPCEVVGFRDDCAIVVPHGDIRGISVGDSIRYRGEVPRVRVGEELIGRVLDAGGNPLDLDLESSGEGTSAPAETAAPPMGSANRRSLRGSSGRWAPLHGAHLNPLHRQRIRDSLPTGVRAIDGLFTVGRGQRMGIFSGSGVGKSVLLGMIARGTSAPVTVIALIGERGREVREFLERDLGPEGRRRAVVVVATGDEPALRRVQAASVATAIAEHFRDEGRDVCLLMDSVTRVALAQREIGLSAGEPPATRGYPPSTFALLARLLERTGPGARGSITAFYTVLVEGDDLHDPIGDTVRGILDGHLWLSRDLAAKGHYPALDALQSISRVMSDVVPSDHLRSARDMISMIARYRGVEELLQMGAYVPGGDPRVDEAVRAMPQIEAFLLQEPREAPAASGSKSGSPLDLVVKRLQEAIRPPRRAAGGGGGARPAAASKGTGRATGAGAAGAAPASRPAAIARAGFGREGRK